MSKRITIFAVHYGSGKTNVAVNYAIWQSEKHPKVSIADLDIVNPYFRSKDSEKILDEKGIRLMIARQLRVQQKVAAQVARLVRQLRLVPRALLVVVRQVVIATLPLWDHMRMWIWA